MEAIAITLWLLFAPAAEPLVVVPPPVTLRDLGRLPSLKQCREALRSNAVCQEHLRGRLGLDAWRDPDVRAALRETDRLALAWTYLTYARGGWLIGEAEGEVSSGESFRLSYLNDLRDLIGAENFNAGRMWPAVPVWRFARD